MLLHLDKFDDSDVQELHFEPSKAEAEEMLEGLQYEPESPLTVDLTAVRSGSAVRIDGRVEGEFAFQCGRCMSEREYTLDADLEAVVLSRAAWEASYEEKGEMELGAEDLDVSFYEGETIDLVPLVREAILLEMPAFALCPDELREACDAAYEAFVGKETLEESEDAGVDLRWGPLKELKAKMEAESNGDEA